MLLSGKEGELNYRMSNNYSLQIFHLQRFSENQRSLSPTSLPDVEDSNHRLLSRSLTVQSSLRLEIPPYLIIPSSNIKLVETIGQGTNLIIRLVQGLETKTE